jgi:hypothetical protein
MWYVRTKFYKKFQNAHPKSIVGQRVFEYLKSFFVKPLKNKNTCCCVYHVKLNELKLTLNLLRKNNSWCSIVRLSLWKYMWPWWIVPNIMCGIQGYHLVVGGYSVSKRQIWKMAQVCLLVWQLSNVWSA